MEPKIVTIGVYGFDKEDFFQALLDARIDTFCDIRLRRGVRGSTYAFVNSAYLQGRLKEMGIRYVHNIRELLIERVQPWQCGKHQLFDGLLLFSSRGKGYVARWKGIPSMSTGYWIPDKPLTKVRVENKLNYCYGHTTYDEFNIAYVGLSEAIDLIPAGTLIRVSLARWWLPEGMNEERCYLQLSGWYL